MDNEALAKMKREDFLSDEETLYREDFLRAKKITELLCYLETKGKHYEAVYQRMSPDDPGEIRIYQRDRNGNLDITHSMDKAKRLLIERSTGMLAILLQAIQFLLDDGGIATNEAAADDV